MENNFIAKNIAYYIDTHDAIITFGMSVNAEYLFENYLLVDILNNIKNKKIITIIDPKRDFKDSVFIVDLEEVSFPSSYNTPGGMLSRGKELQRYMQELRTFCIENNNSVIVKKCVYHTYNSTTEKESLLSITNLTPISLGYTSDVILMMDNGVIKSVKNRFDTIDIINHSLIAIMREEKINEILKD